jgi:hypothetical protein
VFIARRQVSLHALNEVLAPESTESRHLLEQFGADALYQKLCRTQECYRARLTPKFWRLGADGPPNRFPWEMPEHEQTYREWLVSYEKLCEASATCRFIEQTGTQPTLVRIRATHRTARRSNKSQQRFETGLSVDL